MFALFNFVNFVLKKDYKHRCDSIELTIMTKSKWGYRAKSNCATKETLENYIQLRRVSLFLNLCNWRFQNRTLKNLAHSIDTFLSVTDEVSVLLCSPEKHLKSTVNKGGCLPPFILERLLSRRIKNNLVTASN